MDDIYTLTTHFKTTLDVLNGLVSLGKSAASRSVPDDFAKSLNAEIVEIQREVMAAQSCALLAQTAHASLTESERKLKAKIAEFENWAADKSRYELCQTGDSYEAGFAYRLRKEDVETSEPIHHICPNCYEDRKKSILQKRFRGMMAVLECPRCSAEIRID